MVDWLSLFSKMANAIREEIKPIFGSARICAENIGLEKGIGHRLDAAAEKAALRSLIDEAIPCTVISEEAGMLHVNGGGDDLVILDPIDGTTNALRHIPFYATSIAHAKGPCLSDVDAGLVMDLFRGSTFTALKGGGASLDGARITVSKATNLYEAVISVELSYPKRFKTLIHVLKPLMERTLKLRQLGSTSLELAYVASGVIDAFVDVRGLCRAVDIAASTLIVKEAGGYIVNPEGRGLDIELSPKARTSVVASGSRQLADQIVRLLTNVQHET